MFQSFTSTTDKSTGPDRLNHLREEMRKESVTAFLVPHADEHQNEYLPERAERLSWLTGFSGSAGFCIATLDKAIIFVDGRYTLQVKEQIDTSVFSSENLIENPPAKWLETNTGKGDIIAYDPWLITISQLENYEEAAAKTGTALKPVDNLIDRIWQDQPDKPSGEVQIHDIKHAGKPANEKIAEIQEVISDAKCDFTVLTDPASLAWLVNIRGNDVVHNPLALGYAIVPSQGKPLLFMDACKLGNDVKSYLSEIASLHEQNEFLGELAKATADRSILCDSDRVPAILATTIKDAGGTLIDGRDPVILPRAIKNEAEINGTRNAHLRDGVAVVKFLEWLDAQTPGSLNEIAAAKALEKFRAENAIDMGSKLKEVSFDTISGSGPNGAIVHYRVNEQTNRTLGEGELYLCDSGAQYIDGTTDITRTIAIGTPPPEAITDFTLVLKGHIAIALARFPKATRGIDLDVLARNALWQHGKDYAHGTGHGVGSYMNVHEGPQGIHKRAMEPLVPGMIISNEPGYYVEGKYGIRIENLVLVREAQDTGGNIETHSFETLTFAPIDLRLVDKSMLNDTEINWLNAYHEEVYEKLSPHLQTAQLNWLKEATKNI